MMRDTYKNQE